jgi:anti-sigma regulatory factor (Ser/Thr protein kinase)
MENGGDRHSSVNWRKVLNNYRGGYNFGEEWEIIVLEMLANAVDAKATQIEFRFYKNGNNATIICMDNGKGMDYNEFIEYHNLGSLTKDKTSGTIGFAGIGAKLCIDLCDKIYSETNSGKESYASEWWYKNTDIEPRYRLVPSKGLLPGTTGTYVEIVNLIAPSLNDITITKLVTEHYQYSIEPYGHLSIFINNNKIINHKPTGVVHSFQETIPRNKKLKTTLHMNGEFFFVDDEYIENTKKNGMEYVSGINIVVCGKTVVREEFFNLVPYIKPGHQHYITGYIRCDELIEITKTSKDDFNKKTPMWWHFITKASTIFEKWLKEINEWYDIPRRDDGDIPKIINEIEKNLNIIINNFPELIKNLPFTSKIKKTTPIVDDIYGDKKGSEIDGGQLTTGTFGGDSIGSVEGIQTLGPNENIKGVIVDGDGDKKVITPQKRVRGPKIISLYDESRKEEIWFDPPSGAFIINTAHPAFIIASRYVEALDTHVTYILFNYLLNLQDGISDDEKKAYLWSMYSTYLGQLR